jgi:hypothetical protein
MLTLMLQQVLLVLLLLLLLLQCRQLPCVLLVCLQLLLHTSLHNTVGAAAASTIDQQAYAMLLLL